MPRSGLATKDRVEKAAPRKLDRAGPLDPLGQRIEIGSGLKCVSTLVARPDECAKLVENAW